MNTKELKSLIKESEILPIKVFYTGDVNEDYWCQSGDIFKVCVKELYVFDDNFDNIIYDDVDDFIEEQLEEYYFSKFFGDQDYIEGVSDANEKVLYEYCLKKAEDYNIGKHLCIYVKNNV